MSYCGYAKENTTWQANMTRTNVWVFIEQEEGQIAEVSLELLAKGQELAQTLGSQVWGLLCGMPGGRPTRSRSSSTAPTTSWSPTILSWNLSHPTLYARSAGLVRERQPYIFLFGATPVGRDLAPRVASAAKVGLTADCTDLQIGDYTVEKRKLVYKDLLYQIRPAFGGNIIATIVNPKTHPRWRPCAKV